MIEIKFYGRSGNDYFQYCFGRILAEELGFKLLSDPLPGFPNTNVCVNGLDYSDYPVQKLSEKVDVASVLNDHTKRKIIVHGYFQRYEHYREFKQRIRENWLIVDPSEDYDLSPNDVVVHVRRTDYIHENCALPFSFYEEALALARPNRVFVCTDDPRDPFLGRFKKYGAVIRHESAMDDFKFMMQFNKIIMSASSFCWWAAFLSKAKEIYMPEPLTGWWSDEYSDVDLKVVDEERYIHIKCKEPYIPSFQEMIYNISYEIRHGWPPPKELRPFLNKTRSFRGCFGFRGYQLKKIFKK